MVSTSDPKIVLTGARSRAVHWVFVADALLTLESGSLGNADGRPWVQVASDLSLFTTNQLRRMTRAVLFVRKLVADGQLATEEALHSMPFSHVETAMRIHAFDDAAALKVLRGEWLNPTYPALLAYYQSIREAGPKTSAPMVAGKRAARRFQDASLKLLLDKGVVVPGPDQRVGRMTHGSPYANPDFLIVTRQQGRVTCVDAIDCYPLEGSNQTDQAKRRITQVVAESSFFRHFWVVLPHSQHATTFAEEAKHLHLLNLGVVSIDTSAGDILIHRSPQSFLPTDPMNRRRRWLEYAPRQLP